MMLHGIPVIESWQALEQTKFPTKVHRKRIGSTAYHNRIQKKWIKRWGWEMKPCIFKTANTFIVHPALMGDIRRALEGQRG